MEFVWLGCENVHRTGLAKDGLTGGFTKHGVGLMGSKMSGMSFSS